jgi:hypothetical protein
VVEVLEVLEVLEVEFLWASSLLIDIRLSWKGLPGTNALAYFGTFSRNEEKSFIG